eukprot:g63101.t1
MVIHEMFLAALSRRLLAMSRRNDNGFWTVMQSNHYVMEMVLVLLPIVGGAVLIYWNYSIMEDKTGSKKVDPKASRDPRIERIVLLRPNITQLTPYEMTILHEVILPDELKVHMDDIGGLRDLKDNVRHEVLRPLRHRDLYRNSHLAAPPKGVLLMGPPGTGKTMLAKAIANEVGVVFINFSVSNMQSKWYGDNEKLVAALFSVAQKLAPCILFIDEIDVFLRRRADSDHEVSSRVKGQFMSLWDGLLTDRNNAVLVLATTNRPADLDEAVLRRFTRQFEMPLPDQPEREHILTAILTKECPDYVQDLQIPLLAERTEGFSGSDLRNLCEIAAHVRMREAAEEKQCIEMQKVKLGEEYADETPQIRRMAADDLFKALTQVRPTGHYAFEFERKRRQQALLMGRGWLGSVPVTPKSRKGRRQHSPARYKVVNKVGGRSSAGDSEEDGAEESEDSTDSRDSPPRSSEGPSTPITDETRRAIFCKSVELLAQMVRHQLTTPDVDSLSTAERLLLANVILPSNVSSVPVGRDDLIDDIYRSAISPMLGQKKRRRRKHSVYLCGPEGNGRAQIVEQLALLPTTQPRSKRATFIRVGLEDLVEAYEKNQAVLVEALSAGLRPAALSPAVSRYGSPLAASARAVAATLANNSSRSSSAWLCGFVRALFGLASRCAPSVIVLCEADRFLAADDPRLPSDTQRLLHHEFSQCWLRTCPPAAHSQRPRSSSRQSGSSSSWRAGSNSSNMLVLASSAQRDSQLLQHFWKRHFSPEAGCLAWLVGHPAPPLRQTVLAHLLAGKLDPSLDLERVVESTQGMSCDALRQLCLTASERAEDRREREHEERRRLQQQQAGHKPSAQDTAATAQQKDLVEPGEVEEDGEEEDEEEVQVTEKDLDFALSRMKAHREYAPYLSAASTSSDVNSDVRISPERGESVHSDF